MIQKTRFSFLFLILSLSVSLDAAPMARVLAVANGHSLLIERAGTQTTIELAGVVITDEPGSRALLEWTLALNWVLLEKQSDGGYFVYRTPDALFINPELVTRGLARATMDVVATPTHVIVTYLGTIDPNALPPRAPVPKLRKTPAPETGSGTNRPKKAPPSRRRRIPRP
jgi:hypothetical protein